MAWSVTIGNQTFTNTNVDGTAYADEANGFPAILAAFVSEAGFLKGIGNTSTTSITPSVATHTLTLGQTPGFSVGVLACAKSASDPTHYIIGPVSALNGSDMDIAATISSGATAKSDWVVTYPISGNIFDANGDLGAPNGSISAADADADLNAGGRRTVMHRVGDYTRLGGTAGGGAAIGVVLVNGLLDVIATDIGSNNKTISGGNRFLAGNEFQFTDWGTLASGTTAIAWLHDEYHKIILGGDITLNFQTPDASYTYVKTIFVVQDATGGRDVTFQRAGATTQIRWPNDEPDWAGQAGWTVTRLVAQHDGLDNELILQADADIRS